MADPPNATTIPHLLGITLGGTSVATTQVVAFNRNTGEYQTLPTNASSVVVFDAASFTSGYSANDVIQFNVVGSTVGQNTITINSATGGFQEVTITGAAVPTVSVNL